MNNTFDGLQYLVVGAGFFGSVVAERIAADTGARVVVIDKRSHLGGNAHSAPDPKTGIEVHTYGSHIFHTVDPVVWKYINRFTSFNSYRHRVVTMHRGRVYQMPINLSTINSFYGRTMTPGEAESWLRAEAAKEGITDPESFEAKALATIGRPLYEAFFKGYTKKQWATDPKDLPAGTLTRLPVRYNYLHDYFDDPWQGIPSEGYGQLFANLVRHPNIEVRLNTDFFAIRDQIPANCLVIYSGPIDRYFKYRLGALGWRGLRFEREVLPTSDFQGTSVMNYADADVEYTRIHEFRHFHPERNYPKTSTVIYREYPASWQSTDEPFYPINTPADQKLLEQYMVLAAAEPGVIFGGRLGGYHYLNMDGTIAMALKTYEQKIKSWTPPKT